MAEPVLTETHRYIRFLEATSTKAGTLHPSTTFLELRLGKRCLDIGCGRRESGGGRRLRGLLVEGGLREIHLAAEAVEIPDLGALERALRLISIARSSAADGLIAPG